MNFYFKLLLSLKIYFHFVPKMLLDFSELIKFVKSAPIEDEKAKKKQGGKKKNKGKDGEKAAEQ